MTSRKRLASTGRFDNPEFKAPRMVNAPLVFQRMPRRAFSSLPSSSELKFKDTTTNTTLTQGVGTWTTPGATFLLNGLVPDSTASGRIGRKVMMKSIYIRISFELQAASVGGSPLRCIVVYDKQANATAPAVTDVLVTDAHISPNNISNRDRFVTVFDQMIDTVSVNNNFSASSSLYKKINLPIQFNAGTAGTIADITTGSLYIMFSQTSGITTSGPIVRWYARIRYSDL